LSFSDLPDDSVSADEGSSIEDEEDSADNESRDEAGNETEDCEEAEENPLAPMTTSESLGREFMIRELMSAEGGLWSNRLEIYPESSVAGVNHDVISESMGLLLLYAAYSRDKALFDQAYNFAITYLQSTDDLLYWKLLSNYEVFGNSNASIDDLRVIKALLKGYDCWQEEAYKETALEIAAAVQAYNVVHDDAKDDILVEGASWTEEDVYSTSDLVLSYADSEAMVRLIEENAAWEDVLDNTMAVLSEAALGNGLYEEVYSLDSNAFVPSDDGSLNMILQMLTALNLAEAGVVTPANTTLDFIMSEYDRLGDRVPMSYNRDGTPVTINEAGDFYEDLSVYSIIARLAYVLGEGDFGDEIVEKISQIQISDSEYQDDPVYGAYIWGPNDRVYAFGHLHVLVTLACARNPGCWE